jgi:hypothetical protein
MASNYALTSNEKAPAVFSSFFRRVPLKPGVSSTAWHVAYLATVISGALLSSTVAAFSAEESLEGKTITFEPEVAVTRVPNGTQVSSTKLPAQRIRIVSGYALLDNSSNYDRGHAFKIGEEIDALTDRLNRQYYKQNKSFDFKFVKHAAKFENGELSLSISMAFVYDQHPAKDWVYYRVYRNDKMNWIIDISGDSCALKSFLSEARSETRSKLRNSSKAELKKEVFVTKLVKSSCRVSAAPMKG